MPSLSTSMEPGVHQFSSTYLDATGSLHGAHAARLQHVLSEKAAGWAQKINIRSDFVIAGFYTDLYF